MNFDRFLEVKLIVFCDILIWFLWLILIRTKGDYRVSEGCRRSIAIGRAATESGKIRLKI